MTLRTRRAEVTMLRRYHRVLTNQEIAEAVRRTLSLQPPSKAQADDPAHMLEPRAAPA